MQTTDKECLGSVRTTPLSWPRSREPPNTLAIARPKPPAEAADEPADRLCHPPRLRTGSRRNVPEQSGLSRRINLIWRFTPLPSAITRPVSGQAHALFVSWRSRLRATTVVFVFSRTSVFNRPTSSLARSRLLDHLCHCFLTSPPGRSERRGCRVAYATAVGLFARSAGLGRTIAPEKQLTGGLWFPGPGRRRLDGIGTDSRDLPEKGNTNARQQGDDRGLHRAERG